ncbi:MAG: DTW domain-containing protein [Proteobacteria bacterium]|nr:DTW domain-containing protein [Pseudomonadota bacterium]NDD04282.1 DTW domain-containing protein [Pseudomonadota bacterium]NDG26480.1 DTW domain-containing protein [Pseudomonadota bacterium]
MNQAPQCSRCWKDLSLCICSEIQAIPHQIQVLILQHPGEAKSPLTTTRLVALGLQNVVHRVGLSWGSLKSALKTEAKAENWAVLFVGTQKNANQILKDKDFALVDRGGKPRAIEGIKGIVVLDGTWKQSKTLWWRNPWLLKLSRIILNPELKSLYGNLRKEPREGLLSSLEATAFCLEALGESPAVKEHLLEVFQTQLNRWKQN